MISGCCIDFVGALFASLLSFPLLTFASTAHWVRSLCSMVLGGLFFSAMMREVCML